MRWAPRILLVLVGVVIIVPVVALTVVLIGMNTAAGRNFVVREINHLANPDVKIGGLAGHFPADIRLASVSVADANGVWLTGDDLELRWDPAALWSRNIHVTSLTARRIFIARAPVASPAKPSKGGGFSVPNGVRLAVDRFDVASLSVGPAVTGQTVTLGVTGAAHLRSLTTGDVALNAVAAGGQGKYQLAALIDPNIVDLKLDIAEPPDGLLGHFAGPTVQAPFTLAMTLAGPRGDAALNFAAALGAARLTGAGTLGLDPTAPKADVLFSVPALAPVAALAGNTAIAGSTSLRMVAAQRPDASTEITLNGDLDLTAGPGPAVKLVGARAKIALALTLGHQVIAIKRLELTGAGVSVAASGRVVRSGTAPAGIDLATHLTLADIGMLSPGLGGAVAEDGTITGTARDFSVNAELTGDISQRAMRSGPFSMTIAARNLPNTPNGTLTATGALENSPLTVDASFARDGAGNASVTITDALWRSLRAAANLSLAAGAMLPTGTAKFSLGNLRDVAAFSPLPLAGSVTGDFAHADQRDFALDLTAQHLVVAPSIGAIDATVRASGPVAALAVRVQARIAQIMQAPAQIALAAVLDLDNRAANISTLTASWRGLNAVLQGPAGIETEPGIAVRHLALGLNGGIIRLDGTLTPRLSANASVRNLPASLAKLFAPAIDASGTLSATARITGDEKNPAGSVSLNANAIRLNQGPAAALPPADFAATATLANHAADLNAWLNVGRDIALNAAGRVPLTAGGAMSLHLTGATDLRLTDPILAAQGTILRGIVTPDVTITGTAAAPLAAGTVTLAGGSVENIASGLNLTHIAATLNGQGSGVTLSVFTATAGPGSLSGHGSVALDQPGMPIDFVLDADHATPISSDIVTETFNAALRLTGHVHGRLALAGNVDILGANINIPKSLPPSVADLPIVNRGAKPPPPPPPPPDVALNLLVRAKDRIFVRGDGLFAELGGRLKLTGTAAAPDPQGGFDLIRGDFSLAGRNLQFTQGTVSFNGDGFMPSLDLEATSTSNNVTATLLVGGTAAAPTITLTSTPPLPSDEILAELLFQSGTQSLTPFQAATLAAALAQLSGVGGGANPLDSVRSALGLDELSLGGSGSGPPSIQAGRYVAPGVYVGATQATNGQGTQATVQINLYKGLKLETATGTGGSGASSSVGITYQFNY
jgi:translocation and assembly module TamB